MSLARLLLETRQEVMETLVSLERGELQTLRFGCSAFADPGLFQDLCALHKEIIPSVQIIPSHGDTAALAKEVDDGHLDAAVVSLPLELPRLKIEVLRRDRLVACLRREDPTASKPVLRTVDLQEKLSILLHPDRHPDAHERLMELLAEVGIVLHEYARATHPFELQALVKDGYGVALVREGSIHDSELVTRPIMGVQWTVDSAVIYQRDRYPKTLPLVVKRLRQASREPETNARHRPHQSERTNAPVQSPPSRTPKQMNLLDQR